MTVFTTPRHRSFFIAAIAALCGWVAGLDSSLAKAQDTDPQIQNLLGRFSTAEARGGGKLILSYENSDRSFIYDDALAVLAFVHADQKAAAEQILTALTRLQNRDGSWSFQYLAKTAKIRPAEETASPSGAIAWVAMAIEAYQIKYGADRDPKYDAVLNKTLKYLSARRSSVDWKGHRSRPVVFSPTRANIVSFEHNLDAYAAFLNAPENTKESTENLETARDLRAFLESMWTPGRFNAGFNIEDGTPNADENYLDTQSWGVLALGKFGSEDQDFSQGLATNCGEFRISSPVAGFVSYHPRGRSPASADPVWTEGSLGMMLALKVTGIHKCGGIELKEFESSMDALTRKDGGVPYATESPNADFSTSSSVAGTAWKYFFRMGFNPFHPAASLVPAHKAPANSL